MSFTSLYTKNTLEMGESLIRQLVAQTKNIDGLISLAGGFPAPETFPKSLLADLYYLAVSEEGDDILQYGASSGDPRLIDQIVKLENHPAVKAPNVLITCGSTNAIYYMARTFINPGDVVMVEGPSFLGSVVAFESFGAEVIGVDVDEEGLVTADLKQKVDTCIKAGKTVKFIYTIPEFQNPTGITLSTKRRHELISMAKEYNIPVLEDNPYGLLRYEGDVPQDLWRIAIDEYNWDGVLCVKSFSKVLGPGLRIAYAIGEPDLIHRMTSWTQKVNVTPGCVDQRMVAMFLEQGHLPGQLQNLITVYRKKRNAMLNALSKEMPDFVKWTKPEGGMFLWLYLPTQYNADELFNKAAEEKVIFIPGSKFYANGQQKYNELRLNFSYPTIDEITKGIARLAKLFK